jgi:hypothetical protein
MHHRSMHTCWPNKRSRCNDKREAVITVAREGPGQDAIHISLKIVHVKTLHDLQRTCLFYSALPTSDLVCAYYPTLWSASMKTIISPSYTLRNRKIRLSLSYYYKTVRFFRRLGLYSRVRPRVRPRCCEPTYRRPQPSSDDSQPPRKEGEPSKGT